MKRSYREEVWKSLRGKPHLIPLFTNVYAIPERVFEYDPEFFVVYNSDREKFEIHNLSHYPNTYALTVPYKELDVRALRFLWRNDIRVHGKAIFERVEASDARAEKAKEREWKNWVEDVAKETRTAFARDSWGTDGKVTFSTGG